MPGPNAIAYLTSPSATKKKFLTLASGCGGGEGGHGQPAQEVPDQGGRNRDDHGRHKDARKADDTGHKIVLTKGHRQ
jgi:hypothetical protein